jgi:hypothetical protein
MVDFSCLFSHWVHMYISYIVRPCSHLHYVKTPLTTSSVISHSFTISYNNLFFSLKPPLHLHWLWQLIGNSPVLAKYYSPILHSLLRLSILLFWKMFLKGDQRHYHLPCLWRYNDSTYGISRSLEISRTRHGGRKDASSTSRTSLSLFIIFSLYGQRPETAESLLFSDASRK